LTRLSVYCIGGQPNIARPLCVVVMLLVVSGWRPRVTGVLHAWIAVSVAAVITVPDSGDQLAANLALFLLPWTLFDRRRWHWQTERASADASAGAMIAASALVAVQVQVAVVYLHAAIAKFGVAEWVDGTAMYYFLRQPGFAAPSWILTVTDPIVRTAAGVLVLTWTPLVIEVMLGMAWALPPAVRLRLLLPVGLVFHVAIWLTMGLASFSLTMCSGLLFYLWVPEARRGGEQPGITGSDECSARGRQTQVRATHHPPFAATFEREARSSP
jgi:antimicrobial peptide system SdpB family protein